MMNEMVVRKTEAIAASAAWSYQEILTVCGDLVKTGFLPEHIKTAGQAAAIVLAGRELGMPLMRSLRSFSMVKGKVTENADSQLSRFKADGGKAAFTTLTEKAAVLVLTHPNGDQHTEVFTIEDATRAGLTASGMYSKHPKAMLRSRVITAGLKSVGWDGAVGNYDPEELSVGDAPPAAAEPRTLPQRASAPANGPVIDAEVVAPAAPTPRGSAPPDGNGKVGVKVTIANVSSRKGTTNGKDWQLFTITTSSGSEFKTFDAGVAEAAEILKGKAVTLILETTKTKAGQTRETISDILHDGDDMPAGDEGDEQPELA